MEGLTKGINNQTLMVKQRLGKEYQTILHPIQSWFLSSGSFVILWTSKVSTHLPHENPWCAQSNFLLHHTSSNHLDSCFQYRILQKICTQQQSRTRLKSLLTQNSLEDRNLICSIRITSQYCNILS